MESTLASTLSESAIEVLESARKEMAIGDASVSLVVVTPEMAAGMLKANIPKNRHITSSLVQRYTDLMKQGRWRLSSDAITFDEKHRLVNGQHRLLSALRSNTSQPFIILRGVPDGVFKALDTGKTRSAGDVLSIERYRNSTHIAASARLLYLHEVYGSLGASPYRYRIENEQILDLVRDHPDFPTLVAESRRVAKEMRGLIPISEVSFVYYIMAKADADRARQWLTALATGENLSSGSPVLALRTALLNNMISQKKFPARHRRALLVKSANAYMQGRSIRKLSVGPKEEFPVMVTTFTDQSEGD